MDDSPLRPFRQGYVEPLEKYVGTPNGDLLVTKELEKYSLYNSLHSLREISRALINKLEQHKNYGKKIYKDCLASCKNLVSISRKVSQGELSSLNADILLKRLNSYFKTALDFTPFLALPGNYEAYVLDEIEEFIVKKVGNKRAEEVLQKLMSSKQDPYQRPYHQLHQVKYVTSKQEVHPVLRHGDFQSSDEKS